MSKYSDTLYKVSLKQANASDLLKMLKALRKDVLKGLGSCYKVNCPCESHDKEKTLMRAVEAVIKKAEGSNE